MGYLGNLIDVAVLGCGLLMAVMRGFEGWAGSADPRTNPTGGVSRAGAGLARRAEPSLGSVPRLRGGHGVRGDVAGFSRSNVPFLGTDLVIAARPATRVGL